MAETAVRSAVGLLGRLLVDEAQFLYGVEGKLQELRDELVWMQSFLSSADAFQYEDEIVSLWVSQIKQSVMASEDIIEKFVVHVMSRRRGTGLVPILKRYSLLVCELIDLHKTSSRIDSFRRQISMLTPRLQTYVVKTNYVAKILPRGKAWIYGAPQRHTYPLDRLNEVAQRIVNHLLCPLHQPRDRTTIIHGKHGLGKRTVADLVFHHKDTRLHYCGFAWLNISGYFHHEGVLQQLLSSLTLQSANMFGQMEEKALINEVRQLLEKNRYLVVVDGVQDEKSWRRLSEAFILRGSSTSDVILTTNIDDVAKLSSRRDEAERLRDMEPEKSWEILETTFRFQRQNFGNGAQDEESGHKLSPAFSLHGRSTSDVILTTSIDDVAKPSSHRFKVEGLSDMEPKKSWKFLETTLRFQRKNFGNDGRKVIKLGKEMAKHCDGVPLVLIVLSGMLQKRATLREWQDVNENLTSSFRSGTDRTRSYMDVLFSGYNDLPYHLKTCFLHLAAFPEDYEIPVSKLYRMWVAEGLLALDGFSDGTSLWDVANIYLNEIEQLGMVETVKRGSGGRIKSFRIHNLLREVCLHKAVMENFLNLIDYRSTPARPQIKHIFSSHKRLLRAAVYLAPDVKNILPDSLNMEAQRYLRSLLIFAGNKVDQGKFQAWVQNICHDFRHLRLLDIEGLHLQGKLTGGVRNLEHLRYLSLKDTHICELPSSIANLIFLQILDLRVSPSVSCVRIPNALYKLEQLMHLLLPSVTYEVIKSKVLRFHTLSSLEVLENLDASKFQPKDLLKLCKLRKLTIKDIIARVEFLDDIIQLPAIVAGDPFTCYLRLEGELITQKPNALSGLDCLRRLNIEGKISVQDQVDIGFPKFLKLLRLASCKLTRDPMGILGSLCHLKHLFMEQNCYVQDKMICDPNGFPELRTLHLRGLLNLKVLEGPYGKKLERVVIKNCAKLKHVSNILQQTELTCSPCLSWIGACGTCICYKRALSGIAEFDADLRQDFGSLPGLLVPEEDKIVILWGECGVGKSTLAKKPYSDPYVNKYFDATAWVHYSQTASRNLPRQMVQRLLKDLAPEKRKQELSRKSLDDLITELQQIMQQKRCFVVITDLMNSDLVHLHTIFGDQAFERGSKLLLTINEKPVVMSFNGVNDYQVKPLGLRVSTRLLKGRLGRSVEVIDAEVQEMVNECCSRHPLPIILLAGLLSINASATGVATIKERLESAVYEKRGSARIWLQVSEVTSLLYALSYNDLRYDTKRCFLYLANFPEGAEISVRKLCQMWIGASFLPLQGGPHTNYNLSNRANVYLKGLAERGMVQAVKRGSSTRMSKCKLHVTLHSLCLAKAKEENLLTVINCQHSNDIAWPALRQVVVHVNQGDNVIFPAPSYSDNDVASLLFFPNVNTPELVEENWGWFVKICDRFQRLLVLDLEGMWMTRGTLPNQIESLSRLQYLSLKDTFVSELPPSIANLKCLKTLDLRVLESIVIPDVLGNFMWLCHLYLPKSFHLKSEKLSLHGSAYLLTLVNFSTNKVHLNGASLCNLQKISINEMRRGDDYGCLFESLLSTFVEPTINAEVINEDLTVLSSLQNLREARIKGRISDSVRFQMFPECLRELTLKDTQLKDDPIPVLENLPALTSLSFDRNSFFGRKMTFSSGGFKRLTSLMFRSLRSLEELDLTEAPDHVRKLDLVILDCWRLQYIREVKEDGDEAVTV